jgi:hypothetical protein
MPFLMSAFGFVRGFIAKLSPAQLIIAALVMLAAVQHFHAKRLERHDAATSRALGREKDAHTADIARWKAGSEAATALNKATIAKVERRQAIITKESTDEYAIQLADLRARYDRVRRAAPSHQRPANGVGSSPVPDPASGADADGVPVSPDAALQASEIELRLLYLQEWVRQQAAVDTHARP